MLILVLKVKLNVCVWKELGYLLALLYKTMYICCCTYVWAAWLWAWCGPTKPVGNKHKMGFWGSSFLSESEVIFPPPFSHHYLLMVLELQAKVVPLDEVHVGAHQVQQHLARGFLLRKEEKQCHSILAGTTPVAGFLTVRRVSITGHPNFRRPGW